MDCSLSSNFVSENQHPGPVSPNRTGEGYPSDSASENQHPGPGLQHRTGEGYASDSAQPWVSSLLDRFLSSKEGLVGSLICFVSEMFKRVTSALHEAGLPKPAEKLGDQQKTFGFWSDSTKDGIDQKLDVSRIMRDAIHFHLLSIVVILEQGEMSFPIFK